MNTKKRVVVTGIGPLSSVGIGKESLWKGLINLNTGLVLDKQYINKKCVGVFYKHKINNFNISNFKINTYLIEEIRNWKEYIEVVDLYYLIASIKLALEDGNINYKYRDREDIGLIIAHENPGLESFCTNLIKGTVNNIRKRKDTNIYKVFKDFYSFNKRSAYELQSFMFLFHAAKALNIHGYSLIINNACASGLYAIEAASNAIKCGRNNIMVVSASDHPGISKHLWLKEIGLYAEDGKIKPFAEDRNGFVYGDAGVAIVLEDLEHAKQRKAHIYAEYLGGGFVLEGWKVTLPSVTSNYYRNSISQALERCAVGIEEIDLINTHGVGTSLIDRYEAKAMTEIFGKKFKRPLVTAFKPYVGHTLGASALLETAILLILMEKGIVLPVLNCKKIDSKLDINLVLHNVSVELKTALKLCCGFGGYNAAVLFRKVE